MFSTPESRETTSETAEDLYQILADIFDFQPKCEASVVSEVVFFPSLESISLNVARLCR